jgi:golgi SNAP receptor complex member 1
MEGGGMSTSTTNNTISINTNGTSHQQQQVQLQQDIQLYQHEIPTLIVQLQEMITKKLMVTAVTPSQRAVTTRYEQVLRDTKHDYDRIHQQYIRYQERNELFSNSSNTTNTTSGNNMNNGSTTDPAMEALLRERNSMSNSINHTTNILHQADTIRNELHHQGRSLRNTNSMMSMMTQHIPSINTIVDTIRRRRNSDDRIVALVIAICIIFTFWYVWG